MRVVSLFGADGGPSRKAIVGALAQGIGSSLLEKCLAIAEKQGYKTVHGIVLGENRNMPALGKKLGFEIGRDPQSSDNNLVIHLGK